MEDGLRLGLYFTGHESVIVQRRANEAHYGSRPSVRSSVRPILSQCLSVPYRLLTRKRKWQK